MVLMITNWKIFFHKNNACTSRSKDQRISYITQKEEMDFNICGCFFIANKSTVVLMILNNIDIYFCRKGQG